MTRGERAPHSGQADGRSHSAIARNCVNGPHFLHIYSYVGIDHLHPAKTHPAADQSVAIMETIPVDSWAVNYPLLHLRTSGYGPSLPTCAAQHLVCNLRCCGLVLLTLSLSGSDTGLAAP